MHLVRGATIIVNKYKIMQSLTSKENIKVVADIAARYVLSINQQQLDLLFYHAANTENLRLVSEERISDAPTWKVSTLTLEYGNDVYSGVLKIKI